MARPNILETDEKLNYFGFKSGNSSFVETGNVELAAKINIYLQLLSSNLFYQPKVEKRR